MFCLHGDPKNKEKNDAQNNRQRQGNDQPQPGTHELGNDDLCTGNRVRKHQLERPAFSFAVDCVIGKQYCQQREYDLSDEREIDEPKQGKDRVVIVGAVDELHRLPRADGRESSDIVVHSGNEDVHRIGSPIDPVSQHHPVSCFSHFLPNQFIRREVLV